MWAPDFPRFSPGRTSAAAVSESTFFAFAAADGALCAIWACFLTSVAAAAALTSVTTVCCCPPPLLLLLLPSLLHAAGCCTMHAAGCWLRSAAADGRSMILLALDFTASSSSLTLPFPHASPHAPAQISASTATSLYYAIHCAALLQLSGAAHAAHYIWSFAREGERTTNDG